MTYAPDAFSALACRGAPQTVDHDTSYYHRLLKT